MPPRHRTALGCWARARARARGPANQTRTHPTPLTRPPPRRARAIAAGRLTLPGALAARIVLGRLLHAAERAVVEPLLDALHVLALALAAAGQARGRQQCECDQRARKPHRTG